MNDPLELVRSIYEKLAEFFEITGYAPRVVIVSPGSYRRLLELTAEDPTALNPRRYFRLVIDEILPDSEIQVMP